MAAKLISGSIASPSAKPWAAAIDQLPVARALAPALATAAALPASQTLNRIKGSPATCSARKVFALTCWLMARLSEIGYVRKGDRQRLGRQGREEGAGVEQLSGRQHAPRAP